MRVVLLCVVFLVVVGCSKTFQPYHSTADIPTYSKVEKSSLRHIDIEDKESATKEYGVFSGLDSTSGHYLLVAPRKKDGEPGAGSSNPFRRCNMLHSVTLTPEKALEFLDVVELSVGHWNDDLECNEALYYEFKNAPEHKVEQVSPNVSIWYPSLLYSHQLNCDGSLVRLIIGEDFVYYTVDLDKLDELRNLRDLLEMGMDDLRRRGYLDSPS
ncbi:hypothetical protein ACFL2Z_03860 [Candidatus Eisenbacteria bacterium]|uniref:Uncharacterized protein n=1 Tax=Eiseniibacteriota bacterium TaxID=2212470 RepID=A0ABV6YPP7_UNCEI